MGKKLQGAKLRAKQRAKAALEELQEHQAEKAVTESISNKPDDELFVLDRQGDFVPHHKRPANKDKPKKSTGPSEKDNILAEKLLLKHGIEKVKELAEKGRKLLEQQLRPKTFAAHKTKANYDLWDESNDKDSAVDTKNESTKSTVVSSTFPGIALEHVVTKARKVSKKPIASVAVDVAKSGQSYHPDPVVHKSLIEKAAAVEVARDKAIEYNETPISQGMSAETRALLLGDSDEESSEDEEDDTVGIHAVGEIPKRANKLTRAQRNKQKRRRAEEATQREAKRLKRLMNEISEIPRYKKEIKKETKEQLAKQEEKKARIEAKLHTAKGKDIDLKIAEKDPIHTPTVPIALPDELKSSLRTIKPKGSLVTDRVQSLAERNQLEKACMSHESQRRRKISKRKRKKSYKGRHNSGNSGKTFDILG